MLGGKIYGNSKSYQVESGPTIDLPPGASVAAVHTDPIEARESADGLSCREAVGLQLR
jgi:hypothetical protein